MPFVPPTEAGSQIDDAITSTESTWSSTKIDSEITSSGGGGGGVVIDDEEPSSVKVYSSSKTQNLINGITDLNFRGAYNGGLPYAVNDVATYQGSSWVRINANGGNVGDVPSEGTFWTLLAGKGDQGSTGLSSSLFEYRLDLNHQTASGIQSGHIRFNNTNLSLADVIWFSHLDGLSRDVETFLVNAPQDSRILIQNKTSSSTWITYEITGTVSQVVGSHVEMLVSYLSSSNGASLVHNMDVIVSVEYIVSPSISIGTVSTLSAGSPATVVNSGTSENVVLDFGIPAGATGSAGASSDVEMTFAQASYYGTVPTFDLFNLATGAVSHAGGSLTIGTRTGTTQLGKTYHVKSNVSATANGAVSGWFGATAGLSVYVGQGFKYTYSFALMDTSTNAATRTMIGISQNAGVNTLNATATVASITQQFVGVVQEVGESTFSFYSRGSTGNTKVDSQVSCTTPNSGWYTLTLHNQPNSDIVRLTLTHVAIGTTSTSSLDITCGTTNTINTTSPCYPLLQRNMASASGTTGSGSLGLGAIKMYYR
jgi:hypothetical protein